ncbi:head GIN domain-containing protein [Pedobacter sp. P351]|uniref:head GIN domain-containing protein n=1 Tax=Pedobacter superstes TaxID=3133441 RepID=UPI0030B11EE0
MNKLLSSFGWILLLLPFISVAGTKSILHTIQGENKIEERPVSNFTGISSSGAYDVYVKIGTTEDLRIEGEKDYIKNIETNVENGTLKIRNSKSGSGWSWTNFGKTKIYITAKSLNNLTLSGSGNMIINNTIKSDQLNTSVSGSGSIRLNMITTNYNAAVSGSGNINAIGHAKKASIAISGSGGFEGQNLKTATTDIKVSGSGNATIYADEQLNAHLSGSGNITYSGNAQVNQAKSGSGKITKN